MRIFLVLFLLSLNTVSYADDRETFVYGAAARPDGGENVFMLEQPDNLQNPLGNPIVEHRSSPQVFGALSQESEQMRKPFAQVNGSDCQNSPDLDANALGKDFQNTLLEANNRVYDVQSFPEQDIDAMSNHAQPETIYSPNVNEP